MKVRLSVVAVALHVGCTFTGESPDQTVDAGELDGARVPDSATDSTSLPACFSQFDDFQFSNNFYEVLPAGRSFNEAVQDCGATDGARLVVIETEAEHDVIGEYLAANNIVANDCPNGGTLPCAWIGLQQTSGATFPAENWEWVDGTPNDPLSSTFGWFFAEPNDVATVENGEEDCGQLIANGMPDNGWNDNDCGAEMPAVCECNSL